MSQNSGGFPPAAAVRVNPDARARLATADQVNSCPGGTGAGLLWFRAATDLGLAANLASLRRCVATNLPGQVRRLRALPWPGPSCAGPAQPVMMPRLTPWVERAIVL